MLRGIEVNFYRRDVLPLTQPTVSKSCQWTEGPHFTSMTLRCKVIGHFCFFIQQWCQFKFIGGGAMKARITRPGGAKRQNAKGAEG